MRIVSIQYTFFTARNIFFFQTSWKESDVFPKNLCWNMIFLVLSGKMIFLFSENMILHLRWKMKHDLSLKNTRKYDIFFKLSEKMVFPKRPRRYMTFILSGIMVFFSRKHDIFSLGIKREAAAFLRKYMEIWHFLCIRTGLTNMALRHSVKKESRMVLPRKNTPRLIS